MFLFILMQWVAQLYDIEGCISNKASAYVRAAHRAETHVASFCKHTYKYKNYIKDRYEDGIFSLKLCIIFFLVIVL